MRLFWIPGLLSLFLVACAEPHKTMPVSGSVTLDGKPVGDGNDAIIRFEPVAGKGNTGESLLKEGKYLVQLTEGAYKVAIVWNRKTGKKQKGAIAGPGQESEQVETLIPAKFNTATTLTAEVNAGKLVHNFDLKK